jgi:hypothetical protein
MKDHPEEQRLSAAKPLEVTLYTRPGCHLCEGAKAAKHRVDREQFRRQLMEAREKLDGG